MEEIKFNTITKVTKPDDKKYMCLGIKLYPAREVFCDERGNVYMEICDGYKTYHNPINGWHSRHKFKDNRKPWPTKMIDGIAVLDI